MILMLVLAGLLASTPVVAHEMTPTYPKPKPAPIKGVVKYELSLFNARRDVDFYELGVFDADWNPLRFAATDRILRVPTNTRVSFDIYIRKEDMGVASYICSKSKLIADGNVTPVVSSVICSRVDGELP